MLRLKPELTNSRTLVLKFVKHKEKTNNQLCNPRHCALQMWTVGDRGFCELCRILGYTANNSHIPLPLGPQWELPCI